MAINLNQNTDCCETSCDNTTVNTPGPQGPQGPQGLAGSNGSDGTDGKNGYSVLEGSYLVPDTGISNAINVYVAAGTAEWVQSSNVSNQIVYLTNIGHFVVRGKGTGGSSDFINLEFLDYGGDPANTGDTIPAGTVIAPAGRIGPASSEALLNNKGQLLTHTASGQTSLDPPLTINPNYVLKNDDSTLTGLKWEQVDCSELTGQIDLASQVSGLLPLSDVSTTGASHGSLMYYDGSSWTYLTPGADGTLLVGKGSGAAPEFLTLDGLNIATIAAKGKISLSGTNTASILNPVNIASAAYDQAAQSLSITFTSSVPPDSIIQLTYGATDSSTNPVDPGWTITSENTTTVNLRNTLATATDLNTGVVFITVIT